MKLEDSEMYADSPDHAEELFARGYRPMEASNLEPGMVVVYRETDVFQFGCVGPLRYATVREVRMAGEWPNQMLVVTHDGGTTDVDPEDEVWANAHGS